MGASSKTYCCYQSLKFRRAKEWQKGSWRGARGPALHRAQTLSFTLPRILIPRLPRPCFCFFFPSGGRGSCSLPTFILPFSGFDLEACKLYLQRFSWVLPRMVLTQSWCSRAPVRGCPHGTRMGTIRDHPATSRFLPPTFDSPLEDHKRENSVISILLSLIMSVIAPHIWGTYYRTENFLEPSSLLTRGDET